MEPTDGQLLERYRNGDVGALEALIEKHRRPLFGYLHKMTEGRGDVDDVFQEVWLRVIRHAGRYRDRNFFGWLARIAHNLVIDRARRARPDISLDVEREDGSAWKDGVADDGPDPSRRIANSDLGGRIEAAVSRLPLKQKEVFVMRTVAGWSFKQIASAQRVSINTALARMQYAVARLRPMLEDDYREL